MVEREREREREKCSKRARATTLTTRAARIARRPVNEREQRDSSSQIISMHGHRREVHVHERKDTKAFAFDDVFGPASSQEDVYKDTVAPLVEEVLQGFNCTVFAYGQTGGAH